MPTPAIRLSLNGTIRGMRRLAPVSVFVVPFGMAYGIAAIESGMTSFQAIWASMIVFSGAAQFAILDIWGSDISLMAICLLMLALGARHILMGAALSPWARHLSPRQRLLSATFLSDPNFADTLGALQNGERDFGVLVGGGLIGWISWVLGTGIGAIAGTQLGEPRTYGIDVLMPVYFAALVVPRITTDRRWTYIAVAATVSVLMMPFVPAGWHIILAAVAGGFCGVLSNDD